MRRGMSEEERGEQGGRGGARGGAAARVGHGWAVAADALFDQLEVERAVVLQQPIEVAARAQVHHHPVLGREEV